MQTNFFIQDSVTKEFYSIDGWSNDIQRAHDFKSESAAVIELTNNDLTHSGARKPIVVSVQYDRIREQYKSYAISFDKKSNKFVARHGRKVFASHVDLDILKISIDAQYEVLKEKFS